MYRSPPQLRSGPKGRSVPLSSSSDNKKSVRSLSASSASDQPTATMSPPPTQPDKSSKVIDPALIASCVNDYLSGDAVFTTLITRLTEQLKSVVEEAVRSALTTINKEVKDLRSEVKKFGEAVVELEDRLASRTDELEQYQRRNNIRIFGIEEKEGEDTDAIVAGVCKDKLGLDLPVGALCRSHRVGAQGRKNADGKKMHRAIIVRFVSYRDRRQVYSAKKKLKGTGITIREDLTALRLGVLRRAVEMHGVRNTWTLDGRILWMDQQGRKGAATRLADLAPTGHK